MTTSFGTLYKEVRRAYGLSQAYLAKKIKTSQPNVSKIEAGRAEPDTLQWLRFCKEFKLDPDLAIANEPELTKAIKSLRLMGL